MASLGSSTTPTSSASTSPSTSSSSSGDWGDQFLAEVTQVENEHTNPVTHQQTKTKRKQVNTKDAAPFSSSSSSSSSTAPSNSTEPTPVPFDIDYHSTTPRFSVAEPAEVEKAMEYLAEHGYVVFSNVATSEETEEAHNLFWEWATNTFPRKKISRHNLSSWESLPIMQTGVCWAGGVGSSPFAWFVRSLPTIKTIFSAVWDGEQNLVASFDGCGVFRPTVTKTGLQPMFHENWITKPAWFHVDQNPMNKPNKECVQGLFSVFDQDENTGGLVVVPGSHLQFNSLSNLVKPKSTNDFVPIPVGHFLLDQSCGAKRPKLVHCKAGDFILWDSRTIHCNSPALRDQLFKAKQLEKEMSTSEALKGLVSDLIASLPSFNKEPARLQRLVSYQCMTPFSKIPAKVYPHYKEARLQAVEVGTTTNHWPHEFAGGSTLSKGDVLQPVKLTPYQRELAVGQGQ